MSKAAEEVHSASGEGEGELSTKGKWQKGDAKFESLLRLTIFECSFDNILDALSHGKARLSYLEIKIIYQP